jgi:hypothetical protein
MRLVALGASNLTVGLPTLVHLARQAWGERTGVIAALGLGRSYGQTSRFLARSLPGIVDCGLWRALERGANQPTRAIVTDVGNDVLYGAAPEQLLGWVEACVVRLQAVSERVTVTDLPLESLRRLSPFGYRLFRTLLVPSCRLSLAEAQRRCELVSQGLAELAERRALRLVRPRPEWYGLDPAHIRPRLWRSAWSEIAGLAGREAEPAGLPPGVLRLYLARPERQRLFGLDLSRRQPTLPGLALY